MPEPIRHRHLTLSDAVLFIQAFLVVAGGFYIAGVFGQKMDSLIVAISKLDVRDKETNEWIVDLQTRVTVLEEKVESMRRNRR